MKKENIIHQIKFSNASPAIFQLCVDWLYQEISIWTDHLMMISDANCDRANDGRRNT